jgi:hypothetical protein
MVVVDISGVAGFMPIWGFLLVFVVIYALLGKTKVLGENKFVHLLVSFGIAIIFLVSAQATEYVQTVTPWVVVFIISLVFIVLLVGVLLAGKSFEEFFKPGFGWFVAIVLIALFVFSAIKIFGPSMPQLSLQPQLWGIGILIGIVVFASWLLTKKD